MRRVIWGIIWLIEVAAVLYLGACAPVVQGKHLGDIDHAVSVYHDDERKVTCWLYHDVQGSAAISCLPDPK